MQLVSAIQIETSKTPTDLFEDFWTLCWRRQCKKDARKAWDAINPDDYIDILIAACAWRPILLSRGDTSYTPLPATWLRGERWTDEIPQELQTKPSSHVPAQANLASGPVGPRSPIPPHVQEVLDRLKAKR
jgi:hypothetical protein